MTELNSVSLNFSFNLVVLEGKIHQSCVPFYMTSVTMSFWNICCCLLSCLILPTRLVLLQISASAPVSLLWLTAAVLRSWAVSTLRCSVAVTQDAAGLWDRSPRCALSGGLVSTHKNKIRRTRGYMQIPHFSCWQLHMVLTTSMLVGPEQCGACELEMDWTSITFFRFWQKTGSLHNRLSMTWHEHRQ